jgi:uncharacterized protein YbaA (DUF1428 family)
MFPVGTIPAPTSFGGNQRRKAMSYVDGFVIAVPKGKVDAYKAMAKECMPIWKEFGATDYVECMGDDTPYGEVTSFPRAVQAKDDEIVVFSWIVYPSKDIRDAANKKIMADERLKKMMSNPPFDGKRMIFGGFQPFLGLKN